MKIKSKKEKSFFFLFKVDQIKEECDIMYEKKGHS